MSIPKVSIRQVKAARALLNWSQTELAAASGVSIPTVKRLEAEDADLGGRNQTAAKICEALQRAGIEFINGNGAGVGVRLRRSSR
jgi:transcriptional regulator with XRE-family HTH domain